MFLPRDPNTVDTMKLTDVQNDSDFIDLLHSIKQTLLSVSLQQPPPSGYEFEGMKYFDGKMLKIFQNGSWEDHLDFSKVNFSDILGAPQITSNGNDTDLSKIPNLQAVHDITNIHTHQTNATNNGDYPNLYFIYEDLQSGHEYTATGVNGIINSNKQASYTLSDNLILKVGTVVLSPNLSDSRVLITYNELLPENFTLLSFQSTPIGIKGSLMVGLGLSGDWGTRNSRSGLYVSIYDSDSSHFAWSANPNRNYTDHAYAFDWFALFGKRIN